MQRRVGGSRRGRRPPAAGGPHRCVYGDPKPIRLSVRATKRMSPVCCPSRNALWHPPAPCFSVYPPPYASVRILRCLLTAALLTTPPPCALHDLRRHARAPSHTSAGAPPAVFVTRAENFPLASAPLFRPAPRVSHTASAAGCCRCLLCSVLVFLVLCSVARTVAAARSALPS